MPAVTVEDTLILPRISRSDPTSRPRPVAKFVTSRRQAEGAAFVDALPHGPSPRRGRGTAGKGAPSGRRRPARRVRARAMARWWPPSSYTEPLDVLLLGGLPIRAPIVHHGPFVMNTRAEILQAIEDYRSGRLGIIPADQLAAGAWREPDWGKPDQDRSTRVNEACGDLDQVADVTPSSEGCEDCLPMGGRWVHRCICMSCGQVGRCDDSA